jgi:hypothetical protein
MFDDDTGDVLSTIGGRRVGGIMLVAEVEDTSCSGLCLRLGEIGRVTVDGENHGTDGEADFGVGVGAGIVEKLVQVL